MTNPMTGESLPVNQKSSSAFRGDQEDARLLPRLSTTKSTALVTSAGRELDALVAEKVMGLTGRRIVYAWVDRKARAYPKIAFDLSKNWDAAENSFGTYTDVNGTRIRGGISFAHPHSTSIVHAWDVLERLEADERHILSEITRRQSTFGTHFIYAVVLRQCTTPFPAHWWAEEATAPLSICIAALKSVGAVEAGDA